MVETSFVLVPRLTGLTESVKRVTKMEVSKSGGTKMGLTFVQGLKWDNCEGRGTKMRFFHFGLLIKKHSKFLRCFINITYSLKLVVVKEN